MIRKEDLYRLFTEEEKDLVVNLYERYLFSKSKDILVFGKHFYTPNVWKKIQSKLGDSGIGIQCYGIFQDAERKMISFNNIYNDEFPIKLIKISNTSKFTNLVHKDYLGGLLSLGIERNKIGDLIVKDNFCYVAIHKEISDFILYSELKIGKSMCTSELVDKNQVCLQSDLIEDVILISSLRIDNIVAKLCKISRSKAQKIIEQGHVLIDYVKVRDKSYDVSLDERITIRGVGKFILGNQVGKSKSGKIKIIIKKYT